MPPESEPNNVLHTLASKKCQTAVDAARAVLRNGEDPQAGFGGTTALHVAAMHDNLDMLQLLMHFGADPMRKDREGTTPFDLATGRSREFLIRLLAVPPKRQKGILQRIFLCNSGTLLNSLLKGTRKRLRRITSMPFLRRPPSISDPTPFPSDSHDPRPATMVVEDDPLPLASSVLPGTPLRTSTPPLPDTSSVTTRRGGRPRANATRVISASVVPRLTRRIRSRSLDENLLKSRRLVGSAVRATGSARKVQGRIPTACARGVTGKGTPRAKTPISARTARAITGGNVAAAKASPLVHSSTTPKRSAVERQCARRNEQPRVPPQQYPRPNPSAPPLELTPPKNVSVHSDVYFTADESILDELEGRLNKMNLTDPEAQRVSKLRDLQLRAELQRAGVPVGPITKETRKGYERKLILAGNHKQDSSKHSNALERALRGLLPTDGERLDKILLRELDEGARCFVYLLIDPHRLQTNGIVSLKTFVEGIFYVGKATGERPLAHLVDAKRAREDPRSKTPQKNSAKIERINTIWNRGQGVLTVELGKNIGDKLALTREGCIMTSIGDANLTNMKGGEFYGAARSWDGRTKAQYGTYLLTRAHGIFSADRPVPVMEHNVPNQLFGAQKKK